jgi:integrase
VILDKPIVVGRNTPLELELLDHLIMWTLINANDGSDELFTRRIGNDLKKVLLRKDVVDTIKYIAVKHSLNPKRFSSHSLRRGFATMTEDHGTAITNFMRAGWKPSSKVPQINSMTLVSSQSYK